MHNNAPSTGFTVYNAESHVEIAACSTGRNKRFPTNIYRNFEMFKVFFVLIMQKVKAVPLQAWSGPEGSRKLRFPDFLTTAQDGGKVVSLMHRPPLPPGNTLGSHFRQRLSRTQDHNYVEVSALILLNEEQLLPWQTLVESYSNSECVKKMRFRFTGWLFGKSAHWGQSGST